jgi:D-alanyl-D-alanine carboxypeptidase
MTHSDPATTVRARLDAMLERELPGIQYVVVDEHGVVFHATLGTRDVASGQPIEPDTLQMAFSTTKVVTALCVLKLVDQGKIALDEPLSRYYATHPYGEAVTIRSLLAQTSGVPNPMPLDWFATEGTPFDRHALLQSRLRESPKLAHAPGEKYAYSNLSYWLLEEAIEQASGLDYADYVRRHVLEPLAIDANDARFSLPPAERSATGHSRRFSLTNLVVHWMSPSEYWLSASGPWSRTARVEPHGRAYGGLFTNAAALGTLLRDLLQEEPRSLSRAGKQAMFTQQQTKSGKPIAMTLGWVTGKLHGVRYFGKQGGGLGFHGNVRLYPELGRASALLANRTELSPGPIDARSNALDEAFVVT